MDPGEAVPTARPGRPSPVRLRLLILAGLGIVVWYLGWWFEDNRVASPWLVAGLLAAAVYHWCQLLLAWLLYARACRRPDPPPPSRALSVDVFVCACGEDPALVLDTLAAAVRMRGPHRTWLLDDSRDPRLARGAAELGAGYLTREGNRDAKAGNVNEALKRTRGDILVLFDADHRPEPAFLERSLGWFRNPEVGFVQVMLDFSNEDESAVARGSAGSAEDFYAATSMGMDRLGCATLVGSNALIRRSALESIGGYRPGLAEDLCTSVHLHAAGWKSVYVAEPLAPGLTPAELPTWFRQQLKWSRGVFEVLLRDLPRLWRRLRPGQRLSYLVRCTYYWVGLLVAVHLLFSILYLLAGERVATLRLEGYYGRFLALLGITVLIRQEALRVHGARRRWRLRPEPFLLVAATWPVYLAGWLLALLRVPVGWKPTLAVRGQGPRLLSLLPQGVVLGLLLAGIVWSLGFDPMPAHRGMIPFALAQTSAEAFLIVLALRERRRAAARVHALPSGPSGFLPRAA